jgi:hypothetical protein
MDYGKACRKWGSLLKAKAGEKDAEKMRMALDFLETGARVEETQGLALLVGAAGAAIAALITAALSLLAGFSPLWLIFFAFPAVLYLYLRKYPVLKAASEKRNAAGQMPEVMSYLIMSLRISPNIEKAAEFAAGHSHGLFKRKLVGIISDVRAGRGDAETGLAKLGREFKKWDEFERAMQLVMASALERTEEGRQATLDKAEQVLLGGLAARTEREARSLNTPVMMVFTFGVILPLIFIAIIPFMSLMGVSLGAPMIALMYLIALPLFLFVLVKFISSNRPITIRAPRAPKEKRLQKAFALAAAARGVLLLPIVLGEKALGSLEYAPLLWSSAAGVGVFLLVSTSNTKKARKKTKNLEKGFAETLHRLGVTLSEGRPFEDAMSSVDSHFFSAAAGNIRRLNSDLRSAFFDERFGSLREVYSDTIKSVADILISISNKGSDVLGKVAFRMSDHINNMKKTEFEIERALGSVVSSMRIIAVVVAPLVGGMISSMSVVLADTMVKSQGAQMGFGEKAAPLDPSFVTLVIGAYAMISAAILVFFGTELMSGDDSVLKRHSVGMALPLSVFVFTVCAWGANMLFAGLG